MQRPEAPANDPLPPIAARADLGTPIAQARPVASTPGPGPEPEPEGDYEGTFYAQVGGRETFRRLVEKFYEGVASDPGFRAMYPEEDLRPAAMRLQLFLEQYWGGPTTYSQRRGHPRLRMRHVPFRIDSAARDTWLRHMRTAVESLGLPPLQEATLWDYFDRAAHSLQNTADEPNRRHLPLA
jgi:hemoglobin